jgi:hypothetical protein
MSSFHTFPGSPAFYSSGPHRGEQFQARADLTAGKHWRGHFLYETHLPGSFYAGRDPGFFLRLEISYLYSGTHAF